MTVISKDKLTTFSVNILKAAGADAEQAEGVTKVLLWGNMAGRPAQGVWRLPILTARLKKGLFSSPCKPRIDERTPAVVAMHGDNGIGHYVGRVATDEVIRRAKAHGVGVVTVSNSNFLGALGYHVNRIAEAGMLGILWNNSFPKVAPYGGTKPVFGTNPVAFAAPLRNGRNVVADLSTGASAGSTITRAIEKGEPIEEGIAVETDGTPITDPAKVKSGTLLPFGGKQGYKGYALALMVEIMAGVATGAGISHGVKSMYGNMEEPGNSGHFFIAVDIETLIGIDHFHDRMESLLEHIGDNEGVVLPGEGRWKALDKTSETGGITLDDKTTAALTELAGELDVSLPW